jgi:type IV secretion system protein TrbL
VAEAAGSAAVSPLRSAAASMQSSSVAGGAALTGESAQSPAANSATASAEGAGPPAWARRMKRNQTISQGAAAANHAVRSGDHPASGGGIDLSEGE